MSGRAILMYGGIQAAAIAAVAVLLAQPLLLAAGLIAVPAGLLLADRQRLRRRVAELEARVGEPMDWSGPAIPAPRATP